MNLGQQHILYQVLCDNINIVGGWAQQVMSLMHRIDSHYDAICVSHEGMPLTIDHVRTYVDGFCRGISILIRNLDLYLCHLVPLWHDLLGLGQQYSALDQHCPVFP